MTDSTNDDASIEHFMTRAPHTIAHHQKLSAAHQLMRAHEIRHLPVLDGGKLVGLVSQRDLHLIETLKDVDPEKIDVSEAMSSELYTVTPQTPLREVAREMAAHKYGSAVVVDHGHVVGVFTVTDALRALSGLLEERG
jgi:acetoin utilization protein AcuB